MSIEKLSRSLIFRANKGYLWGWSFLITACGADKSKLDTYIQNPGFSSEYNPPMANFDEPTTVDPYFKILEPLFIEPYWVQSLEMDNAETQLGQLLSSHDRSIQYSFPDEAPSYLPITILGWAPASQNISVASRAIFERLEEVLDIDFVEAETAMGYNNIVIALSIQTNSAGFSYFPNNSYQLGSDIFISKSFSQPAFIPDGLTNYDYEVLVHEIGHALGLKHPFEADLNNRSILNAYEDKTKFTAMSYDDDPATFDGSFRTLDWMALTKLYGVNPEFNSGDNEYGFDTENGTFIIDGDGIDTINASMSTSNIFIDLRYGAHSYDGIKSNFITSGNQLTISHGSNIENTKTGSGNDTVIGNHLPNTIRSGDGDDLIFLGDGEDMVFPGPGKDKIDLSEDINFRDIIVLEEISENDNYDTVYGFVQGAFGDILNITHLNIPTLNFLPIVDVLDVPSGYVNNCLIRVFGDGLINTDSITGSLSITGDLDRLKLSTEKSALLITAASQATGEVQNVYYLQKKTDSIELHHLTQLVGNYLDIDNWSIDNFLI